MCSVLYAENKRVDDRFSFVLHLLFHFTFILFLDSLYQCVEESSNFVYFQKKWLYAVNDSAITQLSLDVCLHYALCTSCVVDPYCGWDTRSQRCTGVSTG